MDQIEIAFGECHSLDGLFQYFKAGGSNSASLVRNSDGISNPIGGLFLKNLIGIAIDRGRLRVPSNVIANETSTKFFLAFRLRVRKPAR